MKKLLISLLCVILVFSCVPFVAKAEEGFIDTSQGTTKYYVSGEEVELKTSGDYDYTVLKDGTAKILQYNGQEGEVTIPSTIDEYTVTSIGSYEMKIINSYSELTYRITPFQGVYISNVVLPNSLKSIDDATFRDCEFKEIIIPNSVTSIGDYAFDCCDKLTNISLSSNVTNIGYCVFYECKSLVSIDVDSSNPNYCSINGNLFNGNKKEIIQYAIGKTDTCFIIPDTVTKIGDYAFEYCASLLNVTIPYSVNIIGRGAFSCCKGLKNLTIPNSVTTLDNFVFYGCEKLTSVIIPDSVSVLNKYLFGHCTSLENVTIPNSVKSIGESVFEECLSLKSITIPDSVISIGGYTFYECESLENINLSKKITNLSVKLFYGCANLRSITIPDNVIDIEMYAFSHCDKLKDVAIPNSVERIDSDAFSYCSSLSNITIPNSITDIEDHTFFACKSLSSITIPASIETIGWNAFYGCTNLTSITIPDTVYDIGEKAFGYYYNDIQKCDEKIKNFKILGCTASEAEYYAKENGFDFIVLLGAKAEKSKIYVGNTTKVKVFGTSLSGTTTFSSSNKKMATVSSKGIVKGKKAGTITIIIKNNGRKTYVDIKVVNKRKNPMTVKPKKITAKAKKTVIFAKSKAFSIKKAKGKIVFNKKSGDKKITITKAGKITVKKGLKKGKTYKFKVKVTAKGNKNYKAGSKTVTVKIKVK